MPTVVNWLPSSKPGSRRCLSDSFSESTIRRSAEANCVKMNAVVKQAALSRKYPRSTSASLQPKPPRSWRKPARNSGGGAQLQLLDGPLRMQIQLRRPLSQVAAKHIQTVIVRRRNRPGRLDRNLFLVHSRSFANHSVFQYRRLGWLNRKRATGSFAGSCRLPTLSAFSSGSPKTGQSTTIRGLHRQIPRSPEIERPPPSLPTPIRLARDSHEPS